MQLEELKAHTYECWKDLSDFNGALIQSENFETEVQQFGNLADSKTWQQAYAAFWARNIFDANSDNRTLITTFLNYTPDKWDYELRHQVLEQFLAIPGAMDCIQNGLEQILGNPIDTQEETIAHGVFELVSRTARRELTRIPARPAGQLPTSTRQS